MSSAAYYVYKGQLTEYADVISNTQLGTTDAVYSGGNVLLQVTAASADTAVKVSKTYIEA